MREPLKVSLASFLLSVPLFLLLLPPFSATLCHAQVVTCSPPAISKVTPTPWVAGHTYNNVVITGTGLNGPGNNSLCNASGFGVSLTNGGSATLSIVSESDTQITATVTLPASDTAQTACVTVNYYQYDVVRKTASVSSSACSRDPFAIASASFAVPVYPTLAVTSVKPDGWWASQKQDITITGTGFFMTSDPGGPSKVTVTDGAHAVTLSNVTVVSSTQITASVDVSKDAPNAPAETATLTATNPPTGGTPQSATANPAPVVLPVPVIKWKNKSVSGDKPQIKNPKVIVGQPVELTTVPTSLPGGFTITGSTWVVPGDDIKSYSGGNSGITIDDNVDLQDVNTAFYWLYPDDPLNVTYNYCATDPNGNQICTSPQAQATFKATRPDISLTVTDPYNMGKVNELPVNLGTVNGKDNCDYRNKMAHMFYGDLHYESGCALPYAGQDGIDLTPFGGDGGTYKFVQVIRTDTLTWDGPKPFHCGPYVNVLDGVFPFQGVRPSPPAAPTMAYDGPGQTLPNFYSSGTRDFDAFMYLLWQPPGTDSIPVPIGHQEWQFKATAVQDVPIGNGKWQQPATKAAGKVGDLVPSTDLDNAIYGYPTWSGPSTISSCDPVAQTQEIEE